MTHHATNTTHNSVDIGLGYHHEIGGLFQFGESGPRLEDAISFVFNQTLERDLMFGAWAQAYRNGNGEYRLKITSPDNDVSAYATLIPNYIAAGRQALANYYEDIPAPPRPASLRSYREIASLARPAVAEPAGSL